jgi:hypothetical protein
LLLQQTSASAKAKRQGADAPQSSQPKRKGAKSTRAGTKRQKVATPPPPPASPIPVESSPSPPDVEIQQAPSPPHPQEVPEADEPQQEEPQAEGTSTVVGEQTTGLAGSITSSAVPPIQTSIVLPQGNIFYNIATDELILIQPHNSSCLLSVDVVPSATLADQPTAPSASSSQRQEIALKQVSHPIFISITCRFSEYELTLLSLPGTRFPRQPILLRHRPL